MPEFFQKSFYGNTVQEWLVSVGVILGSVLVAKVVYWVLKNLVAGFTKKTKTKLDDIILDMVEEPVVVGLLLAGVWYAFSRLTLSDGFHAGLGYVFQFVLIANIAWLVTRLFDALYEEYLVPLAEKSETDLDDQLLPFLRKGTKLSVWSIAIIIALDNAGYNVGAALAGLGIGGLAFAMASKNTVENMFGGLTIFVDQPFKLNDRIKIEGFDGRIIDIGLRSTRLQTMEGRIVTIPNATFSDSPVENVTREPSRKILQTIGLTYDMSAEQMLEAMGVLREIAEANEATEDKIIVSFDGFGDFSMNILFVYYVAKKADIRGTQTEINMSVLRAFGERGLEMAFPTQVVYTKDG
jgi:MscS family membrane protein